MTDDGRLSILGQLRDRRESIRASQTLDLQVPRWDDPEIIVQYQPLEHEVIRRAQTALEKAPKGKRGQAEVDGNVDLLVRACVAVVARIDEQEYSLRPGDPKGEPTTFDPDLAQNLGMHEGATARQVVKYLFITDGDIISAAQELIRWSGYRETEADEHIVGE